MMTILAFIGLAVLAVLIYYALSGGPLPDGLRIILLITAALILLFCLMREAGCAPPFLLPRPH